MTTETEPVPASEHQRLQAEAAAMREALSSFKSAMGGFTISASSEYRDQLEALSTAYNKACAALSSDAGRPLLEERDDARIQADQQRILAEELQRDIDALRIELEQAQQRSCQCGEDEACRYVAESADLRSRLETAEKERDEALVRLGRETQAVWQLAQEEIQIAEADCASEVRRAVEEEREACAKVADRIAMSESRHAPTLADDVATAIRARSRSQGES